MEYAIKTLTDSAFVLQSMIEKYQDDELETAHLEDSLQSLREGIFFLQLRRDIAAEQTK